MPLYRVTTRDFGDLIKTDDCIADARAWAKRALPDQGCTVARLVELKRHACARCGLTPCIARRPGSRLRCA